MAEVKWIKIVTDIFDDEKVLLIESCPDADAVIVIWFKLLCLAGKQNNSGVFLMNGRIPYTEEMLATIFRRPVNTVRMALSVFENYGMIEIIDGIITIPKWDKHQSLDSYEKKKERDRLYQADRREKQRMIAEKSSDNRLTDRLTDRPTESDDNNDPSSDVAVSDKIRLEGDKNVDKESIERKTTPPATVKKKDVEAVVAAWNALGIQGSISMPPSDSEDGKNLKAILTEFSSDTVIEQIRRAGQSSFLSGKRGGWRASFSWICNPENFRKIMTGMYDDRQRESGGLAYRQVGHADDEFDPTEIDGIYEKMLPK